MYIYFRYEQITSDDEELLFDKSEEIEDHFIIDRTSSEKDDSGKDKIPEEGSGIEMEEEVMKSNKKIQDPRSLADNGDLRQMVGPVQQLYGGGLFGFKFQDCCKCVLMHVIIGIS